MVPLCAAIAAGPSPYTPGATNGGIYLSSPITYQNGQTPVFMMDQNGYLKIDLAGASIGPIPVTVTPPLYTPVAPDCQLTVTGPTAISTSTCAGGIPATAKYLLVCNEGSTVRWSQTTTPTTSTGQILGEGAVSNPVCTSFGPSPTGTFSTLEWIEQTGTGSATLDISFYSYQ